MLNPEPRTRLKEYQKEVWETSRIRGIGRLLGTLRSGQVMKCEMLGTMIKEDKMKRTSCVSLKIEKRRQSKRCW